jgi:hypothetical protein
MFGTDIQTDIQYDKESEGQGLPHGKESESQ